VKAARAAWALRRELDRDYLPTAALEKTYFERMPADRKRFFDKG